MGKKSVCFEPFHLKGLAQHLKGGICKQFPARYSVEPIMSRYTALGLEVRPLLIRNLRCSSEMSESICILVRVGGGFYE